MTDNESRLAKPRDRAVRAGACCAALAAAAVLTAGCGTATQASTRHVTRTLIETQQTARVTVDGSQAAGDAARPHAVCDGRKASRIKLRRLVVTLHGAIPANLPRHSARRWTVRSVTKMRKVQRALCALPKQTAGIYNCPGDLGISYRLRYHTARGVLPAVTAETTGCELVTGLGKATRWAAESPRFWTTLRRAIGIAHHRGAGSSTP
jgi:hypothetical protein